MSDGIAEAQDKAGTLFGFERIAAMLRSAAGAADQAAAAQKHGQEDDILVLHVNRYLYAKICLPMYLSVKPL